MYDACTQVGLANPREVDELAIWEIAAILGVNRADDGTHDAWPEDAPISLAAARQALAAQENRPPVTVDTPPPDADERRRLLALIGRG